jgi:hypothetical protein
LNGVGAEDHLLVELRSVPVIVTAVPPDDGPEAGSRAVIVGLAK